MQFQIYDYSRQIELESLRLAPYACPSQKADATRRFPESPHAYRMAFARDRDRIVHSRAFRRLKHKRQVFLTNIGDHFRTRLTHTMEVSQLGRTIVRALGLNEDLTEAIALGHDLGHTPFGHLGESVLNKIMLGKYGHIPGFPRQNLGGFKHNYQSLRVVDLLEKRYEFPGLNLTAPVREGIWKHTGLRRHKMHDPDLSLDRLHMELNCASTLEGQVVAIADEIAQRTHDLEDGMRAGLVSLDDVRQLTIVRQVEADLRLRHLLQRSPYLYRNRLINGLINFLVSDVIHTALEEIARFYEEEKRFHPFTREIIRFSPAAEPLQKELNKFIYEKIIYREEVRKFDEVAEEVILHLFKVYAGKPELIPDDREEGKSGPNENMPLARRICDHIAGMTDPFAVSELKRFQEMGYISLNFDIDQLQLDWMK